MSRRMDDSCKKGMRIGVDLGGTKIEFVALESDGRELHRHRVATPRDDYDGTVRAIKEGVEKIEVELGRSGMVGIGIPGTISQITHHVKNANSTWMNGRPLTAICATRCIEKCGWQMMRIVWQCRKRRMERERGSGWCLR